MNINPNRPTDEQIIAAIKSGKTQMQIIKELGTHSQRIMQVKELISKKEVTKYRKSHFMADDFLMECY